MRYIYIIKPLTILLVCFTIQQGFSQKSNIDISVGGTAFFENIGSENPIKTNILGGSIIFTKKLNTHFLITSSIGCFNLNANDKNAKTKKIFTRNSRFNKELFDISSQLETIDLFKMESENFSHIPYLYLGVSHFGYIKKIKQYIFKSTTNIDSKNISELYFNFAIPLGIGYEFQFGDKKIESLLEYYVKISYSFTNNLNSSHIT